MLSVLVFPLAGFALLGRDGGPAEEPGGATAAELRAEFGAEIDPTADAP